MSPRWGYWEPVWLKLKISNWDTKKEREVQEKEKDREMPEEAGRHRIYWQGKKMNRDGREISQSGRTESVEEQKLVQKGELACASEQNGLGAGKTSQHTSLSGKA